MSQSTRPQPDAAVSPPVAVFEQAVADRDIEPDALQSLSWPRGSAASVGFTLLAAAVLSLPAVIGASAPALAAIAVVPVIAIAYIARLVFETLAPRRCGLTVRRVVAAACGATGGASATALLLLILVPKATADALLLGAGLTFAVFLLAGTVRDLEVRIGTANRRIVLVGADTQYLPLAREIAGRGDLHLSGSVSLDSPGPPAVLEARLAALSPTTLVLSAGAIQDPAVVSAATQLHARGVRVRSLPDFYEEEFFKVAVSELAPAWFLFDVASIHDHRVYGRAKRVAETVTAAAVLLMASPLLPLIALVVRMSSPGPILFRQTRVGLDGELIRLLKFRTMRLATSTTTGWATDESDRITPAGRHLRRFHLDELPQLLNVVRGDLALVGPRPEQPATVEKLAAQMQFYNARHRVRPGLTGWAQVNYGYGGTTADVLEKLQYEFFYIKYQSLLLDLRVLVATIRTMVSGSGS